MNDSWSLPLTRGIANNEVRWQHFSTGLSSEAGPGPSEAQTLSLMSYSSHVPNLNRKTETQVCGHKGEVGISLD